MSIVDLIRSSGFTAFYSLLGLACGVTISALLMPVSLKGRGAFLGKSLAIGLKSVPAFIFPILLGKLLAPGALMKVLVSGLICFFPILISAQESFGRVPTNLQRIADSYGSKWWRRLLFLEGPWLLVGTIEGLKAAAPLAVVGAVVAEFVSATDTSKAGLGALFASNRNSRVYLTILSIVVTALGCALFAVISIIKKIAERRFKLVE